MPGQTWTSCIGMPAWMAPEPSSEHRPYRAPEVDWSLNTTGTAQNRPICTPHPVAARGLDSGPYSALGAELPQAGRSLR
jgi:hypothetical protein